MHLILRPSSSDNSRTSLCWELATILMGHFIISVRKTGRKANSPTATQQLEASLASVQLDPNPPLPLELQLRIRDGVSPSPVPELTRISETEEGHESSGPASQINHESEPEFVELSSLTPRLPERIYSLS